MAVLYLTRPGGKDIGKDPVLAQFLCRGVKPRVLEVLPGDEEDRVFKNVVGAVSEILEKGAYKIFVVIDAFLGTQPGQFEMGKKWSPSRPEVDGLLELSEGDWSENKQTFLSLRLVWRLWATTANRSFLLVSINGVEVAPEARFALSQAFGEGRVSYLYGWNTRLPASLIVGAEAHEEEMSAYPW